MLPVVASVKGDLTTPMLPVVASVKGDLTTPMLPVVAIIGRTNVGKSALFNRLIARRTNLVDATPGLTRDRLYGDVTWRGLHFRVVDTGGLQFSRGSTLAKAMEDQVAKAMEEASLALFVCDAKEGLTPLDSRVADWTRPRGKPTLLVVNKVDAEKELSLQHEFFELGMGEPLVISALHGLRVGELLDAIVERLKGITVSDTKQKPVSDTQPISDIPTASDAIRVAIVGRPNVGKSSLVNRILNEERVLVDATPGTTRDPVDSYLTVGAQRYCLIDTAGIRAKRRLNTKIDAIARLKALEAIERSDVCLGVLDASCGIIQDDLKLLDKVVAAGKPICLVVNKWDLVAQSMNPEIVTQGIARRAPFLRFYPVVCASAKSGTNVLQALEQARDLAYRARHRISDEEREHLLKFLQADAKAPAVLRSGRITQIVQVRSAPPTFHVAARVKGSLRPSDIAYLEGVFRRTLEMGGVPIRIHLLRKGRRARR